MQPLIHSVLVRPIYPRNVGQCARATMNMGQGKIIIIDSKCEVDCEDARQGAAGAQKPLEERVMLNSWEDFNKMFPGTDRVAMTRRIGKHRKLFPFEEGMKAFVQSEKVNDEGVPELFLIFGPEDHGLDTPDLDHTNMCCHLPIFGDFKSMNLAHAVLVAQYMAHDIFYKEKRIQNPKNSIDKPKDDYFMQRAPEEFFPDEALQVWLTTMGFQIDPTRLNAFETIRKMILRGFPSPKELGTLEKALRQAVRLKEEGGRS